jgi:6-phosphogluconolactonase
MARRRVLALGAGGIAGLGLGPQTLIGGRKAMAQGTPETVVYVSNAGSKEVFVLAMDRATGVLELIEKTPVPGTDKPSPASLPMATSPDKHFLYAQLRSEPYPVSTFAIDRTIGRLKHLGATPLVDQMAYINTDRTGKFLLAASAPSWRSIRSTRSASSRRKRPRSSTPSPRRIAWSSMPATRMSTFQCSVGTS